MTRQNGSGGTASPIDQAVRRPHAPADATDRRRRPHGRLDPALPLARSSGLRADWRCAGRRTTSRRRAARSGTTCPVRPGTSEGCPLSGDSLRGPFDAVSRAGQNIANVGTSLGMTVDQASSVVGVVVTVVPILAVLAVWAVVRIRFVRRATAAQRWMGRPGALELFAVRALSRQPLRRLERVGWTQPEGSAGVTGRRCGRSPISSWTGAVWLKRLTRSGSARCRPDQSRVSLRYVTRCGRAASTPSRSTLLAS